MLTYLLTSLLMQHQLLATFRPALKIEREMI